MIIAAATPMAIPATAPPLNPLEIGCGRGVEVSIGAPPLGSLVICATSVPFEGGGGIEVAFGISDVVVPGPVKGKVILMGADQKNWPVSFCVFHALIHIISDEDPDPFTLTRQLKVLLGDSKI